MKCRHYIFALFALTIMSGCAHRLPDFDGSEFQKGNKGVVLLVLEEQITRNTVLPSDIAYRLRKLNNNDIILSNGYKLRILDGEPYYDISANWVLAPNYARKMLFLEPGFYYIDKIELPERGYVKRTWPAPGYRGGVFYYGGFEVKAHQVTALGRLNISDQLSQFSFEREDALIKKQLIEAGYQDLAAKMKRGSFILGNKSY